MENNKNKIKTLKQTQMAELDGVTLLLAELEFNNKKVGMITEEGVEIGGDDAEYVKITAAQTRSVVKKILKKAGTVKLNFKMFELKVANLIDLMGGKADTTTAEKWLAPNTPVTLEGAVKITTVTGQIIEAKKASLSGTVRGTVGGDDPLYVDCEIEVLIDGKSSPFSITNKQ